MWTNKWWKDPCCSVWKLIILNWISKKTDLGINAAATRSESVKNSTKQNFYLNLKIFVDVSISDLQGDKPSSRVS